MNVFVNLYQLLNDNKNTINGHLRVKNLTLFRLKLTLTKI
jgi:hypothetical protein